MNSLHLFAGAGGGILADLILGHKPVAAVEIDDYAYSVLCRRLPYLAIERDVRTFDPTPYNGAVDIINAGFPCQDISAAGSGEGITGSRSSLWSEVVRVSDELRPMYLFLENAPTINRRGLNIVLSDLATLGYDAVWTTLSARSVGAPHLRERWWCLAKSTHPYDSDECTGCGRRRGSRTPTAGDDISWLRESVSYPSIHGLEGEQQGGPEEGTTDGPSDESYTGWWETEPNVDRVADGVASRVDRIRAIGNGQVPLQAALAFTQLKKLL